MLEEYYIHKLYPLQDIAIKIMGSIDTKFYLTGGTALSRFYLNHRYSEDLDFFTNRDTDFKKSADIFIRKLNEVFSNVNVTLYGNDFLRMLIDYNTTQLKVELINDVGYHYNGFLDNGCKIDNWQNILSNKISAISRNAAKDYADIIFLSLKYSFNWIEIFEQAKAKDAWVNEIEIAGMMDEFEANSLIDIKWCCDVNQINFKSMIQSITKDILLGADNSLYGN